MLTHTHTQALARAEIHTHTHTYLHKACAPTGTFLYQAMVADTHQMFLNLVFCALEMFQATGFTHTHKHKQTHEWSCSQVV